MSSELDPSIQRLLELAFDPVEQAERAIRLAHYYEHECTRPWRWYCRLCGAKGEAPERAGRDAQARDHLASTDCGCGAIKGRAESGRLTHVWTYGW